MKLQVGTMVASYLILFLYLGLFLPPLYNSVKFDVCEEKTGIVQKAKATQLAAKLVDKGLTPYREEVYECVAKMSSVFTVVLNPDWIDTKNLEDPRGLYYDGVNCTRKHIIFTEDSAIALAGIKWVRDTLF
ncbi:hypothetical protein MTO96_005991 [Rhipicephalus appendiculatus]